MEQSDVYTGQYKPRFDVLALTFVASIVLTLVLTLVFHLPVFILGGFLPFIWLAKRR